MDDENENLRSPFPGGLPPPPAVMTPVTQRRTGDQRDPAPAGRGVANALGNLSATEEEEEGDDAESTAVANNNNVSRQRSKFVRTEDVADEDMLDIDVCLRKDNYGVEGSREFIRNMDVATAALDPKFGVAKHRIVTRLSDTDEDNQTRFQHVQQSIVSILHRVREGHSRAKKMDFMDISTIPRMTGDTSSSDPADWWDNTETNIWTDWDQLDELQVRGWQYSINKRFGPGDRVASRWLQMFVENSSTDELRTATLKKYEKLATNQRGGVIYLYYTLCTMFTMSREVKQAMLNYLDYFKNKGLAKVVRDENVLQAEAEVVGVCKRLHAAGSLHPDTIIDVLQGLSICSVHDFHKMFDTMLQNARFHNYSLLEGVNRYSPTIDIIEAIFAQATATYDMMNMGHAWTVANKGGGAGKVVGACFNCEKEDCSLQRCKEPRDEQRIARNRQRFYDKSGSNKGRNDKRSGGHNNRPQGQGQGQQPASSADYQRKQWEAAGIHLVNGVLKMHCKVCGYNDTHGTNSHNKWSTNKNCKMPPGHPLLKAREAYDPAQGAPTAPPKAAHNVAPPPNIAAAGTTSPSGDNITLSRTTLTSRFDEFERNSTDPNAANIAAAMRAMFLN